MNPLDLVPAGYRIGALALVLAIGAGAAGLQVHRYGATRYADGQAEVQRRWTAADLVRADVAIAASAAARTEEQRRAAAQKEIEDAHQKAMQLARADASIADAAAGRLRQRVAALIAAARGGAASSGAAPVGPGEAAEDATGVFADLLGRCVARVRFLAAVADERGAAGTTCELDYDVLTAANRQP